MITILFIHQSAEMYGSDKTLLLLLKYLDKTKFNPIVALPFDGPLKKELEKENITVILLPVLKLYRKMFTPNNILNFIKDIKRGFSELDKLHEKHHFDIIYSNTLAVLLGIFYAHRRKLKHLWHIHEIIEKPLVFSKAFQFLIGLKANTKIVYNSFATQNFWNISSTISSKALVIWNGLEISKQEISETECHSIRKNLLHSKSTDIIIGLVGRISRWKGQLVLLEAYSKIEHLYPNIKLVFIGSPPPNQNHFLENLSQEIIQKKVTEKVFIVPFQESISKIWQSIDIAVVPSIEPEPFGLVAVEAMLAKKPVIASNHGGLTEIVLNNETGFLIEPNNINVLTESLINLIENSEIRKSLGENGYKRAIKDFSVETYVANFEKTFNEIMCN